LACQGRLLCRYNCIILQTPWPKTTGVSLFLGNSNGFVSITLKVRVGKVINFITLYYKEHLLRLLAHLQSLILLFINWLF